MKWSTEQYREWVMDQIHDFRKSVDNNGNISFSNEKAKAFVNFYDHDIIELSITNSREENCFYLHFQLNEPGHAMDLTREMLHTFEDVSRKTTLRVLLTCSSALTTSFFAQRLNEACSLLNMDYSFGAVSVDHIYDKGFDADVILLAPQISFQYPKLAEIFHDKLVLKIPPAVFAQYDSGRLLELIRKEYAKKIDEGVPEENTPLRSIYENEHRILTIAVINHLDGTRFGYRIYDHGKKTLDKEVIKPHSDEEDLYDLLDYVMARHKNIDYIGISLPGVTHNGSVDIPRLHAMNQPLASNIYKRYHVKTILLNDVNAMALGYHAMHEDTDNMVFYFMPRGMSEGGAGVILDGKLHRGYRHSAGEIWHMTDYALKDTGHLVHTPEGSLQVLTAALLAYISTIAPEKIVYYAEMNPDPEEVRKELSKYIDDAYIPELIHVNRLKRYQLPGTMIRCLEVMKFDEENPDWWKNPEIPAKNTY